MKRLLPVLVLACALPAWPQAAPAVAAPAQAAPAPQAAASAASDKVAAAPAPAPATAPAAAASTAAASPVPSGEPAFTGFVDLGYRWVGTGGSFNTYRSVVDLGSGVKLLGTEFEILGRKQRLFDRIAVRAYNWGDDPYATFHLTVTKNKVYDFNADYRNIAYYNNLPGFADPLLPSGVVLNEQSLDTRQHMGSYQLTLRPESWLVPYLAYERNSSTGNGVANFVSTDNEFPVGSIVNNSTDNYRGGIRIEQPRFHITLEQGGTTFRDDQQLGLAAGSAKDYGNFLGSVLGQKLVLTSLAQDYRVRGHSIYSKGLLTASLASWFDLYGQFLYSEPQSNVYYQQADTGNQLLLSQLLFYTGEQSVVSAESKLPHTSGSLGAELRPLRRLRVVPVWLTDRMHTTSSGAATQSLTTTSSPAAVNSLLSNALVSNYSQAEVNVMYELAPKVTVRGGYRYVWGNASDVLLPVAELTSLETGTIRRNVALAGIAWRPSLKASLNADFEGGSSTGSYFRTSLYNYQKGRVRGRYQITPSFSIAGSATLLNNQNPGVGIHYDYFSHQETASFLYSPSGGKRWDIQGSYTRATLRSDITYLDPAYETPQRSFYRDDSHVVSVLFDGNIPIRKGTIAKVSFGGSFYMSSGSNPTNFYQPQVKLSVPLQKTVAWVSEWRYYGFDESFYGYQAFRTQMVTTGVRLTR